VGLKLEHLQSISEITGSSEMWCWRRMEMISCADRARKEEALQSQEGEEYLPYSKMREG